MTTRIDVRLPDQLVAYVDALVEGGADSRDSVVTRALRLYQQQLLAERDAAILEASGDYDEFEGLAADAG